MLRLNSPTVVFPILVHLILEADTLFESFTE